MRVHLLVLALVSVWLCGARVAAVQRGASANGGVVREFFRDCPTCPEMVVVPAGSFMMGEARGPQGGGEGPVHRVSLPSFAIGRYEVTRGEYARFVAATRRRDPHITGRITRCIWRRPGFAQDDRHPVTCVNFVDAQAYVHWLSQRTGRSYRLPSESEWEYAARAGATTAFSFGDAITPDQAQYDWSESYRGSPTRPAPHGTARVGSFPANAFGLYDMHGNVWEWVGDCGRENYDGAPTNGARVTTGDLNCEYHTVRSGSWTEDPQGIRSANRIILDDMVRDNEGGFRVARDIRPPG
jgi:formylglycine-generating enzyme required for sulfatase activity